MREGDTKESVIIVADAIKGQLPAWARVAGELLGQAGYDVTEVGVPVELDELESRLTAVRRNPRSLAGTIIGLTEDSPYPNTTFLVGYFRAIGGIDGLKRPLVVAGDDWLIQLRDWSGAREVFGITPAFLPIYNTVHDVVGLSSNPAQTVSLLKGNFPRLERLQTP